MKQKIKKYIKDTLGLKHPKVYINDYMLKNRLKKDKIKYKTKYDSNDIINELVKCGLKKGDTLFLHSSWDQFFNYTGAPRELIDSLLKYLGEHGTLAMPCFPEKQDATKVFNVKRTPSGAGFITELFRRYKGTKRSINLNHSVCAIGKNAEYLTKDHHLSLTAWDKYSPYYRLKEVDALIVGLGVGHNLEIATSLHCTEALLKDEIFYFSTLFQKKITYEYKDLDGNIGTHTYLQRQGIIDTKKIAKYYTKEELKELRLSNLAIYAIRAETLIDKALELGKRGITMYIKPKPKKKLFYKINND